MSGKAKPCQDCPNRQNCSSGKIPEDPDKDLIRKNLKNVKETILIMSGKGGVGKSTVSVNLAYSLAENPKHKIALVDADICGPSVPLMTNTQNEGLHTSAYGISPISVSENLFVISSGHFFEEDGEPLVWRGNRKTQFIKQLFRDVIWNDIDIMVIDTPPGTSDEHLSLISQLTNIRCAILVSTPQNTSLIDVQKQITLLKKAKIPIFGIIENMSHYHCPNCKNDTQFFPTTTGVIAMALKNTIPHLGSVPISIQIAKASDNGDNLFQQNPSNLDENTITFITFFRNLSQKLLFKQDG